MASISAQPGSCSPPAASLRPGILSDAIRRLNSWPGFEPARAKAKSDPEAFASEMPSPEQSPESSALVLAFACADPFCARALARTGLLAAATKNLLAFASFDPTCACQAAGLICANLPQSAPFSIPSAALLSFASGPIEDLCAGTPADPDAALRGLAAFAAGPAGQARPALARACAAQALSIALARGCSQQTVQTALNAVLGPSGRGAALAMRTLRRIAEPLCAYGNSAQSVYACAACALRAMEKADPGQAANARASWARTLGRILAAPGAQCAAAGLASSALADLALGPEETAAALGAKLPQGAGPGQALQIALARCRKMKNRPAAFEALIESKILALPLPAARTALSPAPRSI